MHDWVFTGRLWQRYVRAAPPSRHRLAYTASSVSILSVYALLLWATAQLVPVLRAESNALFGAGLVLAVAIAADPLRRAAQQRVYRSLHRKDLDYRFAVRELSRSLTSLLSVAQIADEVTRVLASAMDFESIVLCVFEAGEGQDQSWEYRAGRLRRCAVDPRLRQAAEILRQRPDGWEVRNLLRLCPEATQRAAIRRALVPLGTRAAFPLVFRDAAVGLLLLGEKRIGRRFAAHDVDLLCTLANQTAIAVQNARSYEALETVTQRLDDSVRRKTEQLRESHQELRRAYDELQGAQAQLVQSEKMASLGQLVAAVAHELNNPASFVHGALANLEDYLNRFVGVLSAYEALPIGSPEAAEAIARVREQARLDYLLRETPELLRISAEGTARIKRIVDDLRLFARADRGERRTIDVEQSIDGALRLLSARLKSGGVVLRTDYRDPPSLMANEGQLEQVWMNLLTNALDAVEGRPNPEIEIFVGCAPARENTSDGIEVEVTDNGAGIPPEVVNRIFEPFFTTKASGRGTGLGLSIAYGAVKSHAGTIEVDSMPGRGTTVRVRLPQRSSASVESLLASDDADRPARRLRPAI